MKIIHASAELTAEQIYNLTMSPNTQKMADLVGQEIEIENYALYEDKNSKGEDQEILAILTPEKEVAATISPTFKQDFFRMQDLFGSMGQKIEAISVVSGTAKSGRTFITCKFSR